jgi:hypothetical protein
MTLPTPGRRTVSALALLCAGAAASAAETSPYALGTAVTFGRDDNLFRAPEGDEVSDRWATLTLFGTVDETIGRQRLRAKGNVSRSVYDERSDLDHTGYDLSFDWDGATANEISWNLGALARRSLVNYGTVLESEGRVRNLEDSEQVYGSVQVGLQAQWVAALAASYRRVDYSAPIYADEQHRIGTVGGHVQWNPLGPVSLSVGPRWSQGRYPQARDLGGGVYEADEYDRVDVDFGAKWVPTGASTLNARVSLTRQEFDVLGDRDFEGTTGYLTWDWQATGNTRLRAVASRDTGSETSFFSSDILGPPQRGTGDSSQVTNALALRADYAATAKITLALGGQYARRWLKSSSRLDDGTPVSDLGGEERSSSVLFAILYAPTRNSLIGCEFGHHRRKTDTTLSSPYSANTTLCSGRIAFDTLFSPAPPQ